MMKRLALVCIAASSLFTSGCLRHLQSARQLSPGETQWNLTIDEFPVGPVRLSGTYSRGFEHGDISAFAGSSLVQSYGGFGGRLYASRLVTVSSTAHYRFLYAQRKNPGVRDPVLAFGETRAQSLWNNRLTFGPGNGSLYGGLDSVVVLDAGTQHPFSFLGWLGGVFIGANWAKSDDNGFAQIELVLAPIAYTEAYGWTFSQPSKHPLSILQGVQFGWTIPF